MASWCWPLLASATFSAPLVAAQHNSQNQDDDHNRQTPGPAEGPAPIPAELLVERGEHVKLGQLLLRLDPATPQAQVVLAERAFEVALASHARSNRMDRLEG